MSAYIHELPDWPRFRWRHEPLMAPLASARYLQGQLIGKAESLTAAMRTEAECRVDLRQKTDATTRYDQPLTEQRILTWHAALFPAGDAEGFPSGDAEGHRHPAGAWRADSAALMHVVSGPMGIVHFEAPAAVRISGEMREFLDWFNHDATTEPVLKAALAHLWFVTIHPFRDGNGEIAGALTDMALARSEGSAQRFYSMSAQIREERDDYYRILERTQLGTMDVTPWMVWFLGCLARALEPARTVLSQLLANARDREKLRDVPLNDRQHLMISRLLESAEGRLTTSTWAAQARCSPDTALRDIQQLVARGVLVRGTRGGRSTSYALAQR
jgi:Fic family protein